MSSQEFEKSVEEKYNKIGFNKLTDIQKNSYVKIVKDENVLLIAPTGSGKTEAAIIPVIMGSIKSKKKNKISAVYITPLKALNRDIFRRVIHYAEAEGLKVNIRHGDTTRKEKQKITKEPPDVLITTPETLGIMIGNKSTREILTDTKYVIIDEFHELIGNERGTHLSLSLERLQELTVKKIVRIGLSATLGNVNTGLHLLSGESYKSTAVLDHTKKEYDISNMYIKGDLFEIAKIILKKIKETNKATLLFTNTRVEAEAIGSILKAKEPEFPIEIHHGSLSREAREDAETRLRSGQPILVVCTSSLELGLDIGSIDNVMQFGSPRQAIKLIQRMGRSKHRTGEISTGIILSNRIDDELESLALIDRVEQKDLEEINIHENSLDVLCHQITGMLMENGKMDINKVVKIANRSYPFRNTTREEIIDTVNLLNNQGIVRFDGKIIRRGFKIFEYYFHNLSTIPDSVQFEVIDISKKRIVGRLDQLFVGEYAEPGEPFILKGNSWRIVSIDDDKMSVHVEPMFSDVSRVPHWVGELIPVEFKTAQRVGKLRKDIANNKEKRISDEQKQMIEDTENTLGIIPDDRTLVIEQSITNKSIVIHSCLGSRVNQTLSTLLSTIISSKNGYLVDSKSDAYRISLSSQGQLSQTYIEETLKQDIDFKSILEVAVIGTHPLNWKTWHVAKRFGVVSKDSKYDKRAARLIKERFKNTPLDKEIMRELILEKYDLKNTLEIMNEIKENKIAIKYVKVSEFSSLAKPILDYANTFAALPLTVEKSIIELVKKRLEETNNKLLCLSCGVWETVVKPKDIMDIEIQCPRCKSRIVTRTYITDMEIGKIIKKKQKKKKLTRDENIYYRKLWKVSSLIQNHGKDAVLTLSAYGIGPDTAARVLRNKIDEEDMFRKIYLAEKVYVTTRGFWKE
tara:strand:+ start:3907 stop:6648 length:2742 start_codon:yes stop_codon:yes gene_type:complete